MKSNISILTGDAQTVVSQEIMAYQNAVAAHVGGDWSAHNQFRFYGTLAYAEPGSGNTIADCGLLRVSLTGTNTGANPGFSDGVFTLPAINSGLFGPVGAPPVILAQPASLTAAPNNDVAFSVVAASAEDMTYQWYFDGAIVPGATGATYVIVSAQLANTGNYSVTVANTFGAVTSTTATLNVESVQPGASGGGGFDLLGLIGDTLGFFGL
jgi:hypothetical protein